MLNTSRPRPLSDIAYERLRLMILSGELQPGEALRERDLAERIAVSRTPLREALGRLERDGLAVSRPGGGYGTPRYDPATVAQIFELREVIEVRACQLAAERIGEAGIAALRDVLAKLQKFEQRKDLTPEQVCEEADLGIRIHEIIAANVANDLMRDTLQLIYDRLRLLTWVDLLWVDKWPQTRAEHRALAMAIIGRDGARAAEIATQHLQRSRTDALHALTAQQRRIIS